MTDIITLTGVVATPPRLLRTTSGLSITSFRLASSQRRFDRQKNQWVDGDTNWYTVNSFRSLADHVADCVAKGDRVLIAGRLRVRAWENAEKSGTAVEVDADSLGHDLFWGTSQFTKVSPAAASGPLSASGPGPEAAPGAVPSSLPGDASQLEARQGATSAAASAWPAAPAAASGSPQWSQPLAPTETPADETAAPPADSAAMPSVDETAAPPTDHWAPSDSDLPF